MKLNAKVAFGLTANLVALSWGGVAHAEQGDFHVAVQVGYSDPTSTAFNDGTNGDGNPQADVEGDVRYAIALGYEIAQSLIIDAEFSRANYNTDSDPASGTGFRAPDTFALTSDFEVNELTLGLTYEIDTGSAVSPYVRGGAGVTFYDANADLFVSSAGGNTFGGFLPATFAYSGSGSEFTWYAGAGVAVEASENIDVTLEYRYADYGLVATDFDANGDRIQSDLKGNNINLGLRFKF